MNPDSANQQVVQQEDHPRTLLEQGKEFMEVRGRFIDRLNRAIQQCDDYHAGLSNLLDDVLCQNKPVNSGTRYQTPEGPNRNAR